jgi:hypothetical protein
MLSAKKKTVIIDTVRNYERELEHLYARKSAIDSLIASLEEYNRYRTVKQADKQRKSA